MHNRHTVEIYFDFVSPYAYLALTRVESLGERHGVHWDVRPVVYGALLDATGLVGPVEVEAKRRYTFRDVARTAQMLGVPLVGPPAHPFRSLEALRTVCVYLGRPETLALTVALSYACWGEGRDLTDVEVLREVVGEVGLSGDSDLRDRIDAPEIKELLRHSTEAALAAGVFGVPTFRLDGELFWGHDRMDQLGARLRGATSADRDAAEVEQRPRGADRRAAPQRQSNGGG